MSARKRKMWTAYNWQGGNHGIIRRDIGCARCKRRCIVFPWRGGHRQLHTLPFPRSLCELRSGEEDYRRLCDWFGKLQPWQLGRWLTGINSRRVALELEGEAFSYAEVTGCLLLLLASETARREAREGYVWAAVRRPFPNSVERALFAHGQPREAFKDAMEASARKLNLRHVYGQEGTQEYYLSVYLQFGFTRRGMARLANWLVGQPTD